MEPPPIKQAISLNHPLLTSLSLPWGIGDPDDNTLEEIRSIGSDKIRIIRTTWDLEKYPRGMEHAHQTDIAMWAACSGDWLFYLQSDEVVHEDDLPRIRRTL